MGKKEKKRRRGNTLAVAIKNEDKIMAIVVVVTVEA